MEMPLPRLPTKEKRHRKCVVEEINDLKIQSKEEAVCIDEMST